MEVICSWWQTWPIVSYTCFTDKLRTITSLTCTNVISDPPPACSEACFAMLPKKLAEKSKRDYVQEYSRALAFRGLLDMATRAMIRNGDGPALNREWRLMMVEFHNYNHHNYFVIGHSLLASKILKHKILYFQGKKEILH